MGVIGLSIEGTLDKTDYIPHGYVYMGVQFFSHPSIDLTCHSTPSNESTEKSSPTWFFSHPTLHSQPADHSRT